MLLIIQTELLALGWLGMDIKDDNYDDITEPKKKPLLALITAMEVDESWKLI